MKAALAMRRSRRPNQSLSGRHRLLRSTLLKPIATAETQRNAEKTCELHNLNSRIGDIVSLIVLSPRAEIVDLQSKKEDAAMYCPSCTTEITIDARYCRGCGVDLREISLALGGRNTSKDQLL